MACPLGKLKPPIFIKRYKGLGLLNIRLSIWFNKVANTTFNGTVKANFLSLI